MSSDIHITRRCLIGSVSMPGATAPEHPHLSHGLAYVSKRIVSRSNTR